MKCKPCTICEGKGMIPQTRMETRTVLVEGRFGTEKEQEKVEVRAGPDVECWMCKSGMPRPATMKVTTVRNGTLVTWAKPIFRGRVVLGSERVKRYGE